MPALLEMSQHKPRRNLGSSPFGGQGSHQPNSVNVIPTGATTSSISQRFVSVLLASLGTSTTTHKMANSLNWNPTDPNSLESAASSQIAGLVKPVLSDEFRETLALLRFAAHPSKKVRAEAISKLGALSDGATKHLVALTAALENDLKDTEHRTGRKTALMVSLDTALSGDNSQLAEAASLLLSRAELRYPYLVSKLAGQLFHAPDRRARAALYSLLLIAARGLKETESVVQEVLRAIQSRLSRLTAQRTYWLTSDLPSMLIVPLLLAISAQDSFREVLVARTVALEVDESTQGYGQLLVSFFEALGAKGKIALPQLKTYLTQQHIAKLPLLCRILEKIKGIDEDVIVFMEKVVRWPAPNLAPGTAGLAASTLGSAKDFRSESLEALFWLMSIQDVGSFYMVKTVEDTPLAALWKEGDGVDWILERPPESHIVSIPNLARSISAFACSSLAAFEATAQLTIRCMQVLPNLSQSTRLGVALSAELLLFESKKERGFSIPEELTEAIMNELVLFRLLERNKDVLEQIETCLQSKSQ